jgi:hypothetical protein
MAFGWTRRSPATSVDRPRGPLQGSRRLDIGGRLWDRGRMTVLSFAGAALDVLAMHRLSPLVGLADWSAPRHLFSPPFLVKHASSFFMSKSHACMWASTMREIPTFTTTWRRRFDGLDGRRAVGKALRFVKCAMLSPFRSGRVEVEREIQKSGTQPGEERRSSHQRPRLRVPIAATIKPPTWLRYCMSHFPWRGTN